jgi:hypothetical protein
MNMDEKNPNGTAANAGSNSNDLNELLPNRKRHAYRIVRMTFEVPVKADTPKEQIDWEFLACGEQLAAYSQVCHSGGYEISDEVELPNPYPTSLEEGGEGELTNDEFDAWEQLWERAVLEAKFRH